MKIALAADHAGYKLKEVVKDFLKERDVQYQDFGTYSEESTDFVDWGEKALNAIVKGEFDRGILICGTGLGMNILANKFSGVRATPCYDLYAARLCREHNNSNVLILAGRMTGIDLAREIVKVWLEVEFQGGRHKRRLDKLRKIEQKNFK